VRADCRIKKGGGDGGGGGGGGGGQQTRERLMRGLTWIQRRSARRTSKKRCIAAGRLDRDNWRAWSPSQPVTRLPSNREFRVATRDSPRLLRERSPFPFREERRREIILEFLTKSNNTTAQRRVLNPPHPPPPPPRCPQMRTLADGGESEIRNNGNLDACIRRVWRVSLRRFTRMERGSSNRRDARGENPRNRKRNQ